MRVRKITSLERLVFYCLFLAQFAAFAQTVSTMAPNNVTQRSAITITGSGFTTTSTVRFYTGTDSATTSTAFIAGTVTSATTSQITVIVPTVIAAGEAFATRAIRVYNGSTPGAAFTYTYTPPALTPANAGIQRIVTNYNNYWASSTTALSSTQPDNNHSLMAFKYNDTLYSTGGEAAITSVLASNSANNGYKTGNWRALPIRNITGTVPSTATGNPNLIILGNKVDGDPLHAVPTSPAVAGLSVRDVLIDGIRGLNLGTGVTNLPSTSVLNFQASNILTNVAGDGKPDILVSQVAEPDGSFSVYCFTDANGNIVGKPMQVALNGINHLGTYKMDLFTLPADAQLNSAVVNGWTTVGANTRQIRLVAYKLSDFGITEDNKQYVKNFKVMPSGTSDPAFMAYNRDSFSIPAPEIDGQPVSQAVCPGGTATFSITLTATGTEVTYQWEKDGVAIANGTTPGGSVITGATSATLKITNVSASDNGIYRCVATNETGAAFSNGAILNTVVLSSTASPTTTCLGTPVTIEVNASGNTPLYKWYSNTTNSNTGGTLIAGQTNNTYAPPVSAAGTLYYYTETYPTGFECAITKSAPIAVTVFGPSVAGTISANQTVCPNTVGVVTLTGYTGAIQWQSTQETNGASGWANIADANSPTYTNNNVTGITYYRAIVTNGTCGSATSATSSLTANTTYIWTGNTSTNWNTNTNWSCNLIPTATVDVTIPAAPQNQPIVNNDGTAYARTLTVDANASVKIATGATLQVVSDIAVAPAASFVVENNGALVQDNDVTNNGIITVKRNSNALFRLDYTIWSSPVDGQKLSDFSPGTSTNRFYEYRYDINSANQWVEGYWSVSPSEYFSIAKGYLIRMPNSNTTPGYSTGDTAITYNGEFTGVPHNGLVQVPMSVQNNRFTAVGNPYPSPINIKAFFDANLGKIEEGTGIYLWRKKNNQNLSSYVVITLAGFAANDGTNTLTGITPDTYAYGGSDQEGYFTGNSDYWTLSQGQGFIVKTEANLSSPQLTFNNGMRRAVPQTNGQGFFKSAASTASRLWLNLSSANNDFSQAVVAYMDEATLGLDYAYDGRSIAGTGETSLYSLSQDNTLTIQARPQFTATDVVPVGYNAVTAGTYAISLENVDGVFAQGQKVYIKDKAEGIERELTATNNYSFTTEAGTFNDRFEVHYTTTALNADTPELGANNNIIVYKNGENINITSGTAEMTSVNVYDIRGRKLYSNDNVKGTETTISGLDIQQQVIIVEVNTVKGSVSKKVIF